MIRKCTSGWWKKLQGTGWPRIREFDRRVTKLETGGQFLPDMQSLSDEELVDLPVSASEDWPRVQALMDRMSYEQMVRFQEALEQVMDKGELPAEDRPRTGPGTPPKPALLHGQISAFHGSSAVEPSLEALAPSCHRPAVRGGTLGETMKKLAVVMVAIGSGQFFFVSSGNRVGTFRGLPAVLLARVSAE